MKKVLVVGAGRMGKAVAFGLHHLGIEVFLHDIDIEKARLTLAELSLTDVGVINFETIEKYLSVTNFDGVFSAATYHGNLDIAKQSIDAKVPYFDLGGHVGTSEAIHQYSKEANGLVFTDLGLAPGLVNILGEFACDELELIGDKPHTLKLRVGGLPSPYYDMGLLKYNLTWSVEGLINEYLDKCDTLFAGGHCKVDGLTDIEEVRWSNDRVFEAFNTSGGLSHTLASAKARGLVDASYKTLRYKGHCQQVRFLNEAVGGDREKLAEMIRATTVSHEHDIVLVYVRVEGKYQTLTKRYEIFPKDGFTAMQRATAFSAVSVVASAIGNDSSFSELGHLSTYVGENSSILEYRNIFKCSFMKNMEKLGINL